jgi:hypothetical protein
LALPGMTVTLATTEVAVAGIVLRAVARLKLSEVAAGIAFPLTPVRVSVTRIGVVSGTK